MIYIKYFVEIEYEEENIFATRKISKEYLKYFVKRFIFLTHYLVFLQGKKFIIYYRKVVIGIIYFNKLWLLWLN